MNSLDETSDPFVPPSWKPWHDTNPPQPPRPPGITLAEFLANECDDGHPHRPELTALENAKGVKMIHLSCWACETRVSGAVAHQTVRDRFGTDPASVPVTRSNACTDCGGGGCQACCPTPCARCRRHIHTHEHHTAPRALFPDADYWPIVSLCQQCHSHWHTIMTPGMTKTPTPVAEHLKDEWDRYHLARRMHECWCRETDHAYCPTCIDDYWVIRTYHDKYRLFDA